jgi:hypothetical protein
MNMNDRADSPSACAARQSAAPARRRLHPLSANERFLACHDGAPGVTRPAGELPGFNPCQSVFIRG